MKIFFNIFIFFLMVASSDLFCQTIYLKAKNELESAFNNINNLTPDQLRNMPENKTEVLANNFKQSYCTARRLVQDSPSKEDEKRDIKLLESEFKNVDGKIYKSGVNIVC